MAEGTGRNKLCPCLQSLLLNHIADPISACVAMADGHLQAMAVEGGGQSVDRTLGQFMGSGVADMEEGDGGAGL